MKASVYLLLLIGLLRLTSSCQKEYDQQNIAPVADEDFSATQEFEEMGLRYPRFGKGFTIAPLINQVDDPQLPKGKQVGNTLLARTRQGVFYSLSAKDLTPGHVITVWAVVFNQPQHCAEFPEACKGSDLSEPAVLGDAVYTSGGVVRANGTIRLRAFLREGDASGSMAHEVSTAFPPTGLLDLDDGEVHLVIRDHGPAIPGKVYEQRSSFTGGCAISFPPFSAFPVNEGECGNIFTAIHLAE
ncbi:MAG: hypothetical protein KTR30_29720 [Saprospiraceae bacterium]|nr:hypothetical protein [Saprospiraceae bacterium]